MTHTEQKSETNAAAAKPKIVLAYSGGLDTSIILKWLQTERNYDVVCFTADLGQGDEVEEARVKALKPARWPPTRWTCGGIRARLRASRCSAARLCTKAITCWAPASPAR